MLGTEEERPAGRSLLDGGGAGPGGRAEPLSFHGCTAANLHDGTPDRSTAPEEDGQEGVEKKRRMDGEEFREVVLKPIKSTLVSIWAFITFKHS